METSRKVVEICTQYAQKGMFNIFLGIFFATLAFAFVEPYFFIGYLISIAIFGLYQAIFMANAGGAWDNAKKIVEVDLQAKGTELHDASIVGDTVGDPFKDTSSVALNPVIKFTTLFGMLAIELSLIISQPAINAGLAVFFGVSQHLHGVALVLRHADRPADADRRRLRLPQEGPSDAGSEAPAPSGSPPRPDRRRPGSPGPPAGPGLPLFPGGLALD